LFAFEFQVELGGPACVAAGVVCVAALSASSGGIDGAVRSPGLFGNGPDFTGHFSPIIGFIPAGKLAGPFAASASGFAAVAASFSPLTFDFSWK